MCPSHDSLLLFIILRWLLFHYIFQNLFSCYFITPNISCYVPSASFWGFFLVGLHVMICKCAVTNFSSVISFVFNWNIYFLTAIIKMVVFFCVCDCKVLYARNKTNPIVWFGSEFSENCLKLSVFYMHGWLKMDDWRNFKSWWTNENKW